MTHPSLAVCSPHPYPMEPIYVRRFITGSSSINIFLALITARKSSRDIVDVYLNFFSSKNSDHVFGSFYLPIACIGQHYMMKRFGGKLVHRVHHLEFISMGLLSSPAFYLTFFLLVGAIAGHGHKKPIKKPHYHKKLPHETLSNFRLYWHDVVTGDNATDVPVTPVTVSSNSPTGFGTVFVIDDALTVSPDPRSPLVGRAQGFYVAASKEEIGLMMAMNFAFIAGKFNGSSLTILGRNAVLSPVREMPVIGGSGVFRWARGYVQAKTFSFDPATNNAIVEYNIHVLHY